MLYSFETLFVSLIENNFKLQMLATCFIYLIVHASAVTLVEVYVVVNCSSNGRYIGVLVHQALWSTNDRDVMLKVQSVAKTPFLSEI